MLRLLFTLCLTLALWYAPSGDGQAQPLDTKIAAKNLVAIDKFLRLPDDKIDFAQIKLAVDMMIAPESMNAAATIARLDEMAKEIRAMFPPKATNWQKLEALQAYLYQDGEWNKGKIFRYDLGGDPLGKDITNKLIAKYIATRRGNCHSMPLLMVILGQKIGIDITMTTVPTHSFAMFRKDDGSYVNLEATNDAMMLPNDLYISKYEIPPLAVQNGLFLRPFEKREMVVFIASLYLNYVYNKKDYKTAHALIDLMLPYHPREPMLIAGKGGVYALELSERFAPKYKRAEDIPKHLKPEFDRILRENRAWFEKAEALGWREPSAELNKKLDEEILKAAESRRKKGTL